MSEAGYPSAAAGRRRTAATAIAGTAVTIAYAYLAVLQILVLNPLAAVPGAGLEQIWADLAAANESLGVPGVLLGMTVGPVVALTLLVHALWGTDPSPRNVATAYLALLAFGAPAYFVASLGAGMALADTYGISGGDHSPWAQLLHATSGIAFLGLAGLWAWASFARRSAVAEQPRPGPSSSDVLR